jgi:hypothetical protein
MVGLQVVLGQVMLTVLPLACDISAMLVNVHTTGCGIPPAGSPDPVVHLV